MKTLYTILILLLCQMGFSQVFVGNPYVFKGNLLGKASTATVATVATNAGLGAVTNSMGELYVCPWNNLPANITNDTRWYGPWRGTDYIQQAINHLPHFSGQTNVVGGGRIVVYGTNYCPNPLVFSNFAGGVDAYQLVSPAFTMGAVICQTNPCLRVGGGGIWDGSIWKGSVSFDMSDLIISSLPFWTPTNLIEFCGTNISAGAISRFNIRHCWFGPWVYLSQNGCLSTPTTGPWPYPQTNNLVLYFYNQYNDQCTFEDNSVLAMADVFWGADHGIIRNNFFTQCGGSTNSHFNSLQFTSGWWTNSPNSLGASVVLNKDDPELENNYFYSTQGTLAILGVSSIGSGYEAYSRCEGNIVGTMFATNMSGSSFVSWDGDSSPFEPISVSPYILNYTSQGVNPPFNVVSLSYTNWNFNGPLSAYQFTGNGNGLTNLNANNITQQVLTNNQTGTVTLTTINATTVTGDGSQLTGLVGTNGATTAGFVPTASGTSGAYTWAAPTGGSGTTLQTVFGACVDSGLTLPSGSDYIAIGGNIATANADADETRIRCAAGFIGTVTNLQIYFNITSIAIGSGTNIFARFFTNGVLCNSIGFTLLGTSTTGVQVGTNSGTGSLYIANKTNMLSLCLSNNTAGNTPLPRGGYSFQILNEQ